MYYFNIILFLFLFLSNPYVIASTGRTEAESMNLSGYEIVDRSGASNSKWITLSANQREGSATFNFSGPSGMYDIVVRYFDESDGQSKVLLRADNNILKSFTANLDSDQYISHKVSNVLLNKDVPISLSAEAKNGEFLRVDYIEIISRDDSEPTPEPDPQLPQTTQNIEAEDMNLRFPKISGHFL